ncbi:MAG: alpha/beta hydrolase [Deltaproteobacteria bacterium]|nr:alpha/beta hydrolase [Deltaproteobacteria bacterium]
MTQLAYTQIGEGPKLGVLLHGILGSKSNWNSIAKRLAQRLPQWRFYTVDLRNHGESFCSDEGNTLQACGDDLLKLFMELGQEPSWLSGHSFGGKVAMLYAQEFATELEELVVLDSTPGRSNRKGISSQVERVIEVLRSISMPVAHRDEVVEAVLAKGLSLPIAKWMTTNLKRVDEGFQWRFHLDGVEQMLKSYGEYDGWPIFERPSCKTLFVRGGKSDRWQQDDVDKLEMLGKDGTIELHTLENAGHWVHSDDPQGLLRILEESLLAL